MINKKSLTDVNKKSLTDVFIKNKIKKKRCGGISDPVNQGDWFVLTFFFNIYSTALSFSDNNSTQMPTAAVLHVGPNTLPDHFTFKKSQRPGNWPNKKNGWSGKKK